MTAASPDTDLKSSPKTIALIVAAGRGARAGAGGPKQYRPLAGEAVIAHTVKAFIDHPAIDAVRVVIHRDDPDLYAEALGALVQSAKILPPTFGGAERQDSVRLGLESLSDLSPNHVLIHDAARPFVAPDVITRVLDALSDADGAIAALPVFDTLKKSNSARQDGAPVISETISRDGLWRAQTPQGFQYGAILKAHSAAKGQVLTDDAAVAEAFGLSVKLTPGSPDNMKITQAEDFGMAEILLGRREMTFETRTGAGYDVHAFEPGDAVTLCGVDIPHEQKLKGHSDADVGMHALTDALLGAIGDGDIGDHFPPSDPQWKGAASDIFLRKAASLITERGGAIANCDVTLICEAPKIGPHRTAMRTVLAEILDIAIDRVSVKATTSEQLGFTGRREGIAAIASASVRLPFDGS